LAGTFDVPDNQQERLKMVGWIVGITDGEGCFTVSINRNPTTKLGCQILPEFVITQGERSLFALNKIEKFFKCGRVFVNRRHDNHKEDIYRYCVRSIKDLHDIIIPFFKENKLMTGKRKDFIFFSQIVGIMFQKKHLSKNGIEKIGRIIQKMNTKKMPSFLKSSETTCQSPAKSAGEDIVPSAWRHAVKMYFKNTMSEVPRLVSSDPHERFNHLTTVSNLHSVKLKWL